MDTLANVNLPSRPSVFDRNMIETWIAEGSREAIDIAHEVVEDILAHHEPTPIDADVRTKLDRIIKEADEKFVKTTL